MKQDTRSNLILWLTVSLLAISLFFTFNLLVVEYIRILILGMALAIVSITFPGTFHKNYIRICFIAGAYAYVLWLMDPAVNGAAFFGAGAKAMNFYRIVTLIILIIATFIWLFPLFTKKVSYEVFLSKFNKNDFYTIIGILAVGFLYGLMEFFHAHIAKTSVVDAFLKSTKFIDCLLLYVLVLHNTSKNEKTEKKRIYTLLYAFLIFAVFTSLIGAGKAAAAYYNVRIPKKLDNSKGASRKRRLLKFRENLLKVFSLNSHEALIVYEAGYAAGQKQWHKSLNLLKRASSYPKKTIDEEKLMALINLGKYYEALQILESLPLNYKFNVIDAKKSVDEFASKLKNKSNSYELYYLAGLLYKHLNNENTAKKYFSEFLSVYSNNANALYFFCDSNPKSLEKYNTLSMVPDKWLRPRTSEKSITSGNGIITIVNNQQLVGKLWISPGKYKVSILARDAGTPLSKAKNFDPTCKLRVWVDNSFESLRVLSTNRNFNVYSFDAEIKHIPADVVIEFTNDIYDKKHGWDRNVSISQIIFRKIN